MSQQMNFEEQRGYQATYSSPENSGQSFEYGDHFAGQTGQKLGQINFTPSSHSASAGQRLALAIVSVIVLIPLAGILVGSHGAASFFLIVSGLIALGLVCLTIAVINIVFNMRR